VQQEIPKILKWVTDRTQLFTHAELYFSNECLGGVDYEATAGAILISGLFLTFLIEYIARRWSDRRARESVQAPVATESSKVTESALKGMPLPDHLTLKTTVMEVGIVFHSICKAIKAIGSDTVDWELR